MAVDDFTQKQDHALWDLPLQTSYIPHCSQLLKLKPHHNFSARILDASIRSKTCATGMTSQGTNSEHIVAYAGETPQFFMEYRSRINTIEQRRYVNAQIEWACRVVRFTSVHVGYATSVLFCHIYPAHNATFCTPQGVERSMCAGLFDLTLGFAWRWV